MKCLICANAMKDPRILPCNHSYCLECLKSLESFEPCAMIKCPACLNEYKIPPDGVKSFLTPSSFHSKVFIEKNDSALLNNDKAVDNYDICNLCEVNDIKSEASVFNLQCEQSFWNRCGNAHKKFKVAAHHQLTDINNISNDEFTRSEKSELCKEHCDNYLELYCDSCKLFICVICYDEKHNDHNTTNFENLIRRFKSQLEKNMFLIKSEIFNYKHQLKILKDQENKFFTNADIVSEEINKKSLELIKIIEENKNKLLEKLHSFKEQETIRITDLSSNLNEKIENYTVLVECNEKDIKQIYKSDFIKDFNRFHEYFNHYEFEDLTIKENFLNYIFCDLYSSAEHYIEHIFGDVIQTKNTDLIINKEGCYKVLKRKIPKHSSYIDKPEAKELLFDTSKLDDLIITPNLRNKIPKIPNKIAYCENLIFLVFENSSEVEIYDIETMTVQENFHVPGLVNASNLLAVDCYLLIGQIESSKLHCVNCKTLEFFGWNCFKNNYSLLALLNNNVLIFTDSAGEEMVEYNIKGKEINRISIFTNSSIRNVCVLDEDRYLVSYSLGDANNYMKFNSNKDSSSDNALEKYYKIDIINKKGTVISSFETFHNFFNNIQFSSLIVENCTYCVIYNREEMNFYTIGKEINSLKMLRGFADEKTRILFKEIGKFNFLCNIQDSKKGIYIYASEDQSIIQMQISKKLINFDNKSI